MPERHLISGPRNAKYISKTIQNEKKVHPSNVETEHSKVYVKAKQSAEDVDSEESIPCIIHGRQRRPNPTVTSSEQYWRGIHLITIP